MVYADKYVRFCICVLSPFMTLVEQKGEVANSTQKISQKMHHCW